MVDFFSSTDLRGNLLDPEPPPSNSNAAHLGFKVPCAPSNSQVISLIQRVLMKVHYFWVDRTNFALTRYCQYQ